MSDRPPTECIRTVAIIDEAEDLDPYIEVYFEINKNGEMCEALMLEVFPHGIPARHADHMDNRVRTLSRQRISVEERKRYEKFAATIARLTYHGHKTDNHNE